MISLSVDIWRLVYIDGGQGDNNVNFDVELLGRKAGLETIMSYGLPGRLSECFQVQFPFPPVFRNYLELEVSGVQVGMQAFFHP